MIDVYTLQLKRICEAAQRLSEGIAYAEAFKANQAVSTTDNLPAGMTAADYVAMDDLKTDLEALLATHAAVIATFTAFDPTGILDPLNYLGKEFWRATA